ncbi:nuclear transport factor 2 family protein [Mycolicibacterium hippocampi]|uniref:nuclear transport factor 2 family protein n=1 Tax=Mycolicibacterium hippocampi TaxID=659824 RepID=UPI0035158D26
MTFDFIRRRRRAAGVLVAGVLAVAVMVGSGAPGNAQEPSRSGEQQRNADVVRQAFGRGVGGENSFFSILADDVHWTVARAVEPTTFSSRSHFLQDGAGPIQARLVGPIEAHVRELITEGDVVVAIWDGTATARDGRPYVNSYVWVMTMRDEKVVRATAFLDLVTLNELLDRVDPI